AVIGTSQSFPLGGTASLIMVGVGPQTVKQVSAQMEQRHYEGLLR
ncbi:preprotein translocase subunit SecY, partial [Micrococcus sp. SIMBA_144]